MIKTITLVAHNKQKVNMTEWANKNKSVLKL